MIRKLWMTAAAALTLALPHVSAIAQQYGPPSSGPSAAILFAPATLNLVAGLNGGGYAGDGGLANSAITQLSYPVGVAYDSSGNLFFADGQNHVVRRIDHTTGDISTFAGQEANPGFSVGGGVALGAQFTSLSGLVIDTSNNVYVADRFNDVVWKITPGGAISIFAGGGATPSSCTGSTDSVGDGCAATSATIDNAWALGIDASNNIYIADSYNDLVRVVNHSTNVITTFAGDTADAGGFGDCSPQGLYSTTTPPYTATEAHLCFPDGIAFDTKGNAYIADAKNNIIRIVNSSGIISTFAGGGTDSATTNGVPATDAAMDLPSAVYVDPAGRVYMADQEGALIRVVDSSGNINTVMGTTSGELNKASIGEPDTEAIFVSGQYTGAGDGIDGFTMDIYGHIVATDSSGDAITSTGSTGQYYFGSQQVYQTVTTTSLNAGSSFYPPNVTISNPSGVTLNLTGTPTVTGPFAIVTGAGAGTCAFPGSVAPGATCTIVISFTPTVGGSPGTPVSGSIVFDSNANSSPSTITLNGTGIGSPTYSATITSPLAFTSQANVTSAAKTTTLTNTGEGPLTLTLPATFIGSNPTNFGQSAATDCPTTLNGGAVCHFYIDFTPSAATTYSAQLQVVTAPYGTIYSYLSGTGTAALTPTATLTGPAAFPSTTAGSTAAALFATLSNTSGATLNITGITIAGANPTDFAITTGSNACGATLAADAACYIYVTFTPASATSFSATLSVADNAASSPQTATLTGTGTAAAAPAASLTPSPVAFTNQITGTTSGTLAVTLSNTGSAALNISGVSIAGANPTDFAISTGTNACDAVVAASSSCFIYVTFTPASATSFSATLSVADNASGSPQTAILTGTGISFVSNVGSPSPIQAVTVTIATAGTLNSIQALTQGTVNLEFSQGAISGCTEGKIRTEGGCVTVTRDTAKPLNTFSAGTCETGVAYTAGQSCTVNVVFTPLAPGARNGAVVLTDSSGNVLGTTYLPGTGIGPQLVFGPGVQSTLPGPTYASSYQDPLGITVDASGNVYIADTLNGAIAKIPWSGSYGTPVRLATGSLNQPSSIAVDGAGNLFIADTENFRVLELPWSGSAYGTPVVLDAIGLPDPQGVAVDGNGNLYIADALDEKIVELPWTSSGYGAPVNLPVTGLAAPHGMAVDANQNLYIADSGNKRVVELPWTGTAFGAQIVLPASGLFYPEGVAVDGGGNVYIADTDHGKVDKLPWSGTAFGAQVAVPFTLNGSSITTGIAVDGGGNIYLLDGGNNVALKLTVSVPPALSFASTNVGSTSTDSPKTVPVTNIGNASLIFSASGTNPSYPANFPVNSADAGLCSSSAPLTQGASCDVSVNFIPASSGSLSGFVVLTDNDLNGIGATQSIAVSGTGVGASQPVASLTPNPIAFNSQTVATTSAAMQATLSNTGGAALTGIVISIAGANPADFALTTGSNACGTTLPADSACYIYVTFTPASATSFSATLSVADNATGSPQTATLTGTGTAVAAPIASLTPTVAFPSTTVGATSAALAATLSNTGNATLTISGITIAGTNPSDFAKATGSNACGATLAAGASCSIYVTFTPASATSFSATLSVADNATGSPQTATLTGTGTAVAAPVASLTAPAAFPSTTVGATAAALAATLSNTGNAALTISGITLAGTNPTDFAIVTGSNVCGTTLAAGASCSIYVTFTPASAANFAATLTVADNAAGSPQTAALTGTGTAVVVPTYTVASPTPAQTVQPGGAATYTINVTPVNGSFTSLVTLSASGLPTGATATFLPASVTPGSSVATSQLTIQTAAVASVTERPSPWPLAAPALGLIGLFFVSGKRRRWITFGVLLFASLTAITALSGCGGGFGLGNVIPPPSSYTVTVTGTSGENVQTTTVQLTVQ